MMTKTPRSTEQMIDEQIRRWELQQSSGRETQAERLPVVAVSRQFGSGGGQVARELSEELGFDLFDREILQQIVERSHVSERLLATLDERGRTELEDWLGSLSNEYRLSSDEYIQHLSRVVRGISVHGGSVILGRGASFLLCNGEALRVLITASVEARIKRTASRDKISEQEARAKVLESDADRRAFVMKYYRGEFLDPGNYDLVVNTDLLGIPGALASVKAALEVFKTRTARD